MKEVSIRCEGARSVSINDLHPFQDDIKTMKPATLKKLEKVIIEQGFSEPIAVWANSPDEKLWILNGHQRLTALQSLASKGWFIPPIPVAMVQADDEQEARKKVLTLASQFGDFSGDHLAEFVAKAQLDGDWLRNNARLAAGDFKMPILVTPDEEEDLPPQPEVPIVRRGEIYLLDQHRLMCGDSTSEEDVAALMDGNKAQVWSSDPPYGISYVDKIANKKGQAEGYKPIANDELEDESLREFILKVITTSLPHMAENFAFYMWHATKMQAFFSQAAAAAAGILFHRQIIWVKPNFVFGRGQYHWRHELCLMGWLEGKAPPFYGPKNQSTVWEIGGENDKIHPTQKPVAIWEPPMLNHTNEGEIVYEPFSGSGSQFIAAEKLKRRCFGMELEASYCGCILDRWESMSGKSAIRESDGRLWSDIKAEALSS